MNPISFGARRCGNGAPCYIALEIGATHTGLKSALALLDATAEARADALKVQVLNPEKLMGRDAPFAWGEKYGTAGDRRQESLLAILKRRWMPDEDWIALGEACRRVGVDFICSVDFPETLDLSCRAGATALKVVSGDANNLEWIAEVARAGLPIMLDTGMASIGEVERAVDACLAAGNDRIVIHHCPSGYPTKATGVNLRVLTTLRQMFSEFVVAFSDHSPGRDMDVAAVALGAAMVEKTMTLSRQQAGPEHDFSLEPQEAAAFVAAIREVEQALGRPRRVVTAAERDGKRIARRCLFGDGTWRRPEAAGAITPEVKAALDQLGWSHPSTGPDDPVQRQEIVLP